jgi:hypothetical protein
MIVTKLAILIATKDFPVGTRGLHLLSVEPRMLGQAERKVNSQAR